MSDRQQSTFFRRAPHAARVPGLRIAPQGRRGGAKAAACALLAIGFLALPAVTAGSSALAAHRAGARGHRAPAQTPRARMSIIGGHTAEAGSYPSIAQIFDIRGREIGECTGSVIAANMILTAGHCGEDLLTGQLNPASGYLVLTAPAGAAGKREISRVARVIVDRRFSRVNDSYDAALLVLSSPTDAPAIRLPGVRGTGLAHPHAGLPATVAGWGLTEHDTGAPARTLRTAVTVVQRPSFCEHYAPPFFASSEVCTINPPNFATGACHGDSGGPLIATDPAGENVEIGITVHGYNRCTTLRPTVFTRIEALASWLRVWMNLYAPVLPGTTPGGGGAPGSSTPATGTTTPSTTTPSTTTPAVGGAGV
jgi:secreted trypsin-like serine protease